jgi:CheY-like chemotaxis protein
VSPSRLAHVLLVEDNPADAVLVREGFQESGVEELLRGVPDGVEAISYLRREGAYAYAPRPDLVLLDLNLPKKGGRDVLREVKGDENPS